MTRLAGPVVLAELGWMSMGIVDTIMVGHVGAEPLGGVAVGSAVFYSVAIFGMGLLLGLDTLVSHAFGGGRLSECHRWLAAGVALSALVTLPLVLIIAAGANLLPLWGVRPEIVSQAVPYVKALLWGLLPLLLYTAFRRYLQALGQVRPVMFALVTANLVNVAGNWVLIYGHLGAPAMGAEGAGWATCISRTYMAGYLLVSILRYDHRRRTGLRETPLGIDFARIRELVRLGLPAASSITLELGVFATAATLAGRLASAHLAAHQVAISVAGLTFMVPLGISSAGAVRVGHAIGRRDAAGAEDSGWTAIVLGAGFMLCTAVAMYVFPRGIMRIFTTDAEVVATGASLLFLAAIFQLFDGVQVSATGVLRGAGDTRTPMITNLVGHWFLGLPVGYALCFGRGWGIYGMWIGLSLGLIAVGIVLLRVWSRKARALEAALRRDASADLVIQ